MSNLLFLITIMGSCPAPKMSDWTKSPWAGVDTHVYYEAVDGCKTRFSEPAPCLTKFIKRKPGSYYAICGRLASKVSNPPGTREYWFSLRAPEVPGQ